jgi:hypothetical protein
MASFLHATDLHFGRPHNSVGIGKSLTRGLIPTPRSLLTWMATHDRDVALALTDLIVELRDEVDAVVLTGDIATTSAKPALDEACHWLRHTARLAGKRMIALPGNHDRFGPFPSYSPGSSAFEIALAKVSGIETPAPQHGVKALPLDDTCLLVCTDLTLRTDKEANRPHGSVAQGIVRRAKDVTEAITNALTARITHIVVATHFPLYSLPSKINDHECIHGGALLAELSRIAETLPVLVISGHLHREHSLRVGSLFQLVSATASQTLHPSTERIARPSNLALSGAHAAVTVRTEPNGFVATRWRYGTDVTLGGTPHAKRFCSPTEIVF